ncbi:DEAD/DEAH box helicase [Oxalobacteraceae bacterium R-40]|uniref:DEAD/DEAH box helicase n=1 Tax=Keguizhuia sedimenti TaxID=3064264 RepID=A0ABU1BL73_9BURK|nr:DEAD/DEAH box helicase [Oxalobacteraceae bacterium R-40]
MRNLNEFLPSSQPDLTVSVLSPFRLGLSAVKRFVADDAGKVTSIPYDSADAFRHQRLPVSNFDDFAQLLQRASRQSDVMLIRGEARQGLHQGAAKTNRNFQEPAAGCAWVMIDFDNIKLPEGMNPFSREAIEYGVRQMPEEFHAVSYFFQHSASAGILEADGKPFRNKTGLNAHVFFWFGKGVPGKALAAYLQLHCIDTGFYKKTNNIKGTPMIQYGVDLSVIRTPVQPNYIGLAIIGKGVRCVLSAEQRQGVVKKRSDAVALPEFATELVHRAYSEHQRLRAAWCRECGWVKTRSVTKVAGEGVAVSTYFRNPNDAASVRGGREFLDAKPYGEDDEALILRFADENSPGSWRVHKSLPQMAFRFGDEVSLHLRELSAGAYAYVRDTLGWFEEVAQHALPLTDDGYLPAFDSFVEAEAALILAPTGSGKTTAISTHVLAHPSKIIFYAAPTIALCKQTAAELRRRRIRVVFYQDYCGEALAPGVYVTTYQSSWKFVVAAERQMTDFDVILDEIHAGIDEAMRSPSSQRKFEAAIGRAANVLLLTATVTPLQQKKIVETIGSKRGTLSGENFAIYEFQPVKDNPVYLCDSADFGRDLTALLRSFTQREEGTAIPRTVVMIPNSKMKLYRQLLAQHGLEDQAYVVSRPEATEEEIEQARTGNLPILISSPLFALGLNFLHAPAYLFAYFDSIDVDETQIVQTLNRANRSGTACEVRLYVGKTDFAPVFITPEMHERLATQIADYYQEESSLEGLLDIHFMVERQTYCELRKLERDTPKALGRLIEDNAIQNYRIVHGWTEHIEATETDRDEFGAAKKEARLSYQADIKAQAGNYAGEVPALLFQRLDQLYEEKQPSKYGTRRKEREIQTEEKGVLMALCGAQEPGQIETVRPIRLMRLFAEAPPFISDQFNPENFNGWQLVAAEKSEKIAALLPVLKKLRNREIDGYAFAKHMRNTKAVRGAVGTLVDHDSDFKRWNDRLAALDELGERKKTKASHQQRIKMEKDEFHIAQDFLSTLGIYFEKTKGADGRLRIDPALPVVPDWDFDRIARDLLIKAKALRSLPEGTTVAPYGQQDWSKDGMMVRKDVCQRCAYYRHQQCALGMPVQWHDDEPETLLTSICRQAVPIPKALRT